MGHKKHVHHKFNSTLLVLALFAMASVGTAEHLSASLLDWFSGSAATNESACGIICKVGKFFSGAREEGSEQAPTVRSAAPKKKKSGERNRPALTGTQSQRMPGEGETRMIQQQQREHGSAENAPVIEMPGAPGAQIVPFVPFAPRENASPTAVNVPDVSSFLDFCNNNRSLGVCKSVGETMGWDSFAPAIPMPRPDSFAPVMVGEMPPFPWNKSFWDMSLSQSPTFPQAFPGFAPSGGAVQQFKTPSFLQGGQGPQGNGQGWGAHDGNQGGNSGNVGGNAEHGRPDDVPPDHSNAGGNDNAEDIHECNDELDNNGNGEINGAAECANGSRAELHGSASDDPCGDEADNDGDGWIDGEDSGCGCGTTEETECPVNSGDSSVSDYHFSEDLNNMYFDRSVNSW